MSRRAGIAIALAMAAGCTAFGSAGGHAPDGALDASTADARADHAELASGPHVVFVTSGTFTGDEVSDDRCTESAQAAGLADGGRSFKAWIVAGNASAKSRLENYGPWFLLNDGGRVAEDIYHLLPTVERAIDITERGDTVTDSFFVWTGTDSQGSPHNTCNGWTSVSPSLNGTGGVANDPTRWTDTTVEMPCSSSNRVYCFEQKPP